MIEGVSSSTLKTLLLVDDDARNLLALSALLDPLGHRLVTAAGGRAAIDAFEREPPDVVLCDFAMPDCDGIAVLRAIRAHAQRGETPVVIVTAFAEREHRLQALRAGADDFLEKPIDEAVLLARVGTLLRLKQSRDALESAKNELAFQNAALERIQHDQREIVDFILHDLRVPLASLQQGLDWCRRSTAAGDVQLLVTLDEVSHAARRVARMSEDLVSISQLEDDRFPVKLTHVRLDAVAEEALASCRALLEERRVDFVAERRRDGEDVIGDPGLLHRVLENLVDNAIRHTRAGGRIRIEVADQGARVLVSNDGVPLPASEHGRVFEKYDRPDAHGVAHAGLGLYFCKRAMLAQHGDISIVDVDGWPTSFELTLPTHDDLRI
jgi:signal transduction histidine kinase